MSKHTPGPWTVSETQGDNIRSPKIVLIRPIDDHKYKHGAIAYVYGNESVECKSNAVLIAAAPELCDSLEWALGQMEMDAFEPEFPEVKAEWDKAHEILTRVAGRAT